MFNPDFTAAPSRSQEIAELLDELFAETPLEKARRLEAEAFAEFHGFARARLQQEEFELYMEEEAAAALAVAC